MALMEAFEYITSAYYYDPAFRMPPVCFFGNDDTGAFEIVEVDEENPVAVYDTTIGDNGSDN